MIPFIPDTKKALSEIIQADYAGFMQRLSEYRLQDGIILTESAANHSEYSMDLYCIAVFFV